MRDLQIQVDHGGGLPTPLFSDNYFRSKRQLPMGDCHLRQVWIASG
jgi:hypothetical protein